MANMYWKSVNFNSPEELADYVDWVAKENGIDHKTALAAIANAWQATIQWKKINDWDPVDEKVWQQIIPELKPVVWEAWYEAPKSFWETVWDEIIEWVKDSITGYPKRTFWKLATWWYFDWDNINTKKILDEAWIWKKWNKKTNKETDKETTKPDKKKWEKTSSWLLKFGKEATSIEQIENRDRQLAQILSDKWVTDISKVEQFLNKFDTFKEASNENKQRTINRIMNNINNISVNKQKNKQEDKPEVKEEKNKLIYDKEWKAVWSKWTPSNDDSINWVEEELIYDKKWNPVWSKAKAKTNDKKEEKKKEVPNILKSSPTMMNLLNLKK